MPCLHPEITTIRLPMSDGRFMYRERCYTCSEAISTFNLPSVSDEDLVIPSRKHQDKTLKQIMESDPTYVLWVATESRLGDRIIKAAARIYSGKPFTLRIGTPYPLSEAYDPEYSMELCNVLKTTTITQ